MPAHSTDIVDEYHAYLGDRSYPCAGAKAALSKHQVRCLVADDISNASDDENILLFLYNFIDEYRLTGTLYHSAVILFRGPQQVMQEELFDRYMWQRLQSLNELDARNYPYDKRVDANPASPGFSYSLKEEALFIIGMHAGSSRASRRFRLPALAFNPHEQFEQLRAMHKYEPLKNLIRRHDMEYSGSVNPMLDDFGMSSEVYQYSGVQYPAHWRCPLIIHHGKTGDHSSA